MSKEELLSVMMNDSSITNVSECNDGITFQLVDSSGEEFDEYCGFSVMWNDDSEYVGEGMVCY